MPRTRTPIPAPQRGVTLIEVMVGLALGLVVTAGLLILFANTSVNAKNVQRVSSSIENGRYAAELLRDDLQLAGFLGELALEGAVYAVPDPCSTDASTAGFAAAPLALPTPVRGYTTVEALGCLTARNRLAGTDAIAVRRLEVDTTAVAAIGAAGSQYYLQSSFCNTDPSALPLVFDRRQAEFVLLDRACGAANTARAYVSRLYFVASCNVCGRDTLPTLKRLDLVGATLVETPLVEGIEVLRFEYGFDTDNNGSADLYLPTAAAAGPASLWENVMSLRLHLIVRANESSAGGSTAGAQRFTLGDLGSFDFADDGFARRAYTTTVRLINPSAVREVQ